MSCVTDVVVIVVGSMVEVNCVVCKVVVTTVTINAHPCVAYSTEGVVH